MKTWLAALAYAVLLYLIAGTGVQAQTFQVASIATTDLGNVAAAASGQTVFRINAATGAVTKVSGLGVRISGGLARSLVTISCGNQFACNFSNARVTIATTGVPTNRAAALQNFIVSVSGATASIVSSPGAGAPISFTIGPVGRNSTKTFWVGSDFPISGDNSGANSGDSSAQFAVTVSRVDGSRANTLAGSTRTTVLRSLAVSRTGDLLFGKVVRPASGSGSVSLSHVTGSVTVTGNGAIALSSPAPAAASFAISGEGGQSVSITVPSTFTMAGPGGNITVTTTASASGAQMLSGAMGAAGSLAVRVGGAFTYGASTATGSYSGVFTVLAQYN